MPRVKTSDKITRLAEQRRHLKQQIENSKHKILDYEQKLAVEIGHLAMTKRLDQLGQAALETAFDQIAKEHGL